MKSKILNATGLEKLSVHAQRCLASAKIYTLQDLVNFCKENGIRSLLKIRKLGRASFALIEDFLKSEASELPDHAVNRKSNFFVVKDFIDSHEDLQNTPIQNLDFVPTRAKKIMNEKNIYTLKDLLDFCEKYGIESLLRFKDFGKKTFVEIRNFLNPTDTDLNHVINKLEIMNIPENDDDEVYILSEKQLTRPEQIKRLEFDTERYKQAIARTKAKIAKLKNANKTNKRNQEPQR